MTCVDSKRVMPPYRSMFLNNPTLEPFFTQYDFHGLYFDELVLKRNLDP
jgi:hypothetical protein